MKRFLKWVSVFAMVGVVFLAVIYVFRGTLIAPYISPLLGDIIESQLGLRLSVGGIGGSYVTGVEVHDVKTVEATGPVVSIEVQRLKISYSLPSLLKGGDAFLSALTLELDGARLDLDVSQGGQRESSEGQPVALLGPLPRIRAQNVFVSIRGPNYRTDFKGIGVETEPSQPDSTIIKLRIAEWSWVHPNLRHGKASIVARLNYSRDTLVLEDLALDGKDLVDTVQIGLISLPKVVPFYAKLRPAGGHLEITGKLEQLTNLSARLDADGLDVSSISSLLVSPSFPLEGRLSMNANLVLGKKWPADLLVYLDLELTEGGLRGIKDGRLGVHASLEEGIIRIDELALHLAKDMYYFEGLRVPANFVFDGNLEEIVQNASVKFSLSSEDIPSILELAGREIPERKESIPEHRLVLNGEIRDGSVSVSEGSLVTDIGAIRLDGASLALPVPGRPMEELTVRANLHIDLPDLGMISRMLSLPPLSGILRGELSAQGSLASPSGVATIDGKKIAFRDVPIGDFVLRAKGDSTQAVIESVTLRRGKDRITGQGVIDLGNKRLENAELDFFLASVEPYVKDILPAFYHVPQGIRKLKGSMKGKAAATGPLGKPDGNLSIEAQQVRIEGRDIENVRARLVKKGERFTIDSLELRNKVDRAFLRGSFDLGSRVLDQVSLKMAIDDLGLYTKDLVPKKWTVSGRVSGKMEGSGPLLEPDARVDLTFQGLQLGKIAVTEGAFKAQSSRRRIQIDRAEVKSSLGEVSLTGSLIRGPSDATLEVDLNSLSISGQGISLGLDAPAHLGFSRAGAVSLKNVSLSGPTGKMRLEGIVRRDGESDLTVAVSGLSGKSWLETFVGDRVVFTGLDAQIHLLGSMNSPSATVTGSLARISSKDSPFPLSGRFDLSYAERKVQIRQFEWRGEGSSHIAVTGTVPFAPFGGDVVLSPGNLEIAATAEVPDLRILDFLFPGKLLQGGALDGELQLHGTWELPTGKVRFQARGLLPPPDFRPAPPGPFDMDGEVEIGKGIVTLNSLRFSSSVLSLSGKGQWRRAPSIGALVSGFSQSLSGDVNMEGNLVVPDLSWLGMGVDGIRRTAGRLEAKVSLQGPVTDLNVNANLRLEDGELRPDMDLPSVRSLNIDAIMTPNSVKLQSFQGELGGAVFQVSGALERKTGKDSHIDLRIWGEDLLLFRSEGIKVRADTDLTVRGPVSRMQVSGELAVTDGRIVKRLDFFSGLKGTGKPKTTKGIELFSFNEPPIRDMVLNVRIYSKNPFRIRNNVARGGLRPELLLSGTGEIPVLTGNVYVEPTRLSLPAGRLVIESGVVRFLESDPERPVLNLKGSSRMLGYDITLLVEGPYDEPVVTLSSVPPLPSDELLLLVLTGQPPKTDMNRAAAESRSLNVAVFLGKDLLSRWFEGESLESDESVLDRFDVQIGRGITRAGEETVEAQFRVSEGLLGKHNTIYITGEKDVFDALNAGVKIVFRFK